ncbi:hypothetical protein F5Y09DRAFT_346118 [Xylaria sp. FL1042]|nr:hypothetical protein F5Y09DRAFT_346118 [Xylaria sp. FL1042]
MPRLKDSITSIPKSPTLWYSLFQTKVTSKKRQKLTLWDLQSDRINRGEKLISGSDFGPDEQFFLRAFHPPILPDNTLEAALVNNGILTEDCLRYVNTFLFDRTGGHQLEKRELDLATSRPLAAAAAAPETPQKQLSSPPSPPKAPKNNKFKEQWYHRNHYPMAGFFNLRFYFHSRFSEGISQPLSVGELSDYLDTFRTVLSSMSDVYPPSLSFEDFDSPTASDNNNTLGLGRLSMECSPLARKSGSVNPHVESTEPKLQPSKNWTTRDETMNVIYFNLLLNTAITRSHDCINKEALEKNNIFNVLPLRDGHEMRNTCIADRHAFSVGTPVVFTACVDGYTYTPIDTPTFKPFKKTTAPKVNPAEMGFIIEVKRSVKNGPKLQYQVAAELMGWIYSRRVEFAAVFEEQKDKKEQHVLLAQCSGYEVTFYIASFGVSYFEYVAQDSAKPVLVDPGQNGLTDGLLRVQGYGPFNIITMENVETLLRVCIALDLMALEKAGRNKANRR